VHDDATMRFEFGSRLQVEDEVLMAQPDELY